MPRPGSMKSLFSLLLLLAFACWAMGYLMQVRFAGGTAYPVYSSLRPDPLGAKAVYETLKALPLGTSRNYQAPERLRCRSALILVSGLSRSPIRFLTQSKWSAVAAAGNLVFIALRSNVASASFSSRKKAKPEPAKEPEPADKKDRGAPEKMGKTAAPREVKVKKSDRKSAKRRPSNRPPGLSGPALNGVRNLFSGIELDQIKTSNALGDAALPSDPHLALRMVHDGAWPERISWHSPLVFKLDETARKKWQVLYGMDQAHPVMIRSRFGNGSIILATDSYLLSNEALAKNHSSAFIPALVGTRRTVVFDETHFGLSENHNLMYFIRRHGLVPLLIALLVVGLLYLWQSLIRVLPPEEDLLAEERARWTDGRGAVSALSGLIQRHLSACDAVEQCIREFLAAPACSPQRARALADAMYARLAREKAKSVREQDWVACYCAIQNILEERTSPRD